MLKQKKSSKMKEKLKVVVNNNVIKSLLEKEENKK